MDELAERYVRLALALDRHDEGYVDAYFGPPEWRAEDPPDLATVKARAEELAAELETVEESDRRRFLLRQVRALALRAELVGGRTVTFDEEARGLYATEVPSYDDDHFRALVDEIGELLPGDGPVAERYESFVADFVVPPDRVEQLSKLAIEECRRRSARWIDLPDGESFDLSFTRGEAWGGQNLYQGGFHSKIIVNLDMPKRIDAILNVAGHEGYPGHHVSGLLIERDLVLAKGWNEFSVIALYSPAALVAEGAAMLATDVVFDKADRAAYEREVLYPAAGLDPAGAERYEQVRRLAKRLGFADIEVARRYLDGSIDAAKAQELLVAYGLMGGAEAEQMLQFFERYRSYVINYSLGEELTRSYLDSQSSTPERRWEVFTQLLRFPMLP